MAEIENISISLTPIEARAVHRALGEMAGKDYANAGEIYAGSTVYNLLTPLVDDEDESPK